MRMVGIDRDYNIEAHYLTGWRTACYTLNVVFCPGCEW